VNASAIVVVLCIVTAANSAPVLLKRAVGDRFAWPLDFGIVLWDGRRLFGTSKTIRGVVAAVLAGLLVSMLLGLTARAGLLAGLMAMAGDLLSSFSKRRLGLAPSAKATGLDQIPEVLLPALALMQELGMGLHDVLLTVLLFFVGAVTLSPALHRLGMRDEPY
jgi:CDP-2,3-bis-(O-geranylgeranyl)-sn-glycerol synthase